MAYSYSSDTLCEIIDEKFQKTWDLPWVPHYISVSDSEGSN